MDIDIEFDDREVVRALNSLVRAGRELTPAMKSIAGVLKEAAEESFQQQKAPDGTPWGDLPEHTKRQHGKKGMRF